MKVYYNEFDKKKCAALKQLIIDGHISAGDVDDRPIQEVQPEELKDYDRCHFFAGIGLWDYALQLAGWEEDCPVWTGSCPCQPFSTAGRQAGKADDRHLWPEWERLIKECRPPAIFGEQVASAITKGWLDDVYQGLEAEGYAVGSAVLPASAIGAPHRRERLYFVGHSNNEQQRPASSHEKRFANNCRSGKGCNVADAYSYRGRKEQECERRGSDSPEYRNDGKADGGSMAHSERQGPQRYSRDGEGIYQQGWEQEKQNGSAWEGGVWIDCPDGKQRLVEPTIPLLAHGYPERVGVIHCAGDAIVAQLASQFIKASM